MKKILVSVALICVQSLVMAANYSGHITTLSADEDSKKLIFEVENSEDTACGGANWFSVAQPDTTGSVPSEIVIQSFYNKRMITVHVAGAVICKGPLRSKPVRRVTVGKSVPQTKSELKKAFNLEAQNKK